MNLTLLYSIQSEWMKTKRSAAFWLVVVGGFFTPGILCLIYMVHSEKLAPLYSNPKFWVKWYLNGWESMAYLLLPMGIVLATSLIAQLEYKNNAWKQVLTTPQSLTTVFIAKYIVVLLLMFQLFVLFTFGMYLAGALPAWYYGHIPYPPGPFPWKRILQLSTSFYITSLPILAFQYCLSIYFKNFMVSLGVGILAVTAAITALSWRHVYIVPYAYSAIHFLQLQGRMRFRSNIPDIHYLALVYFVAFTLLAYLLYLTKKEKG